MTTITSKRKRSRADSYARRLKAAGLGEEMPEDADQFRNQLARRINMLVNTWHGCPELLCRRNRGCMAPNIDCSNAEKLPPEEEDRQWHEMKADIYKAMKVEIAARGLDDE